MTWWEGSWVENRGSCFEGRAWNEWRVMVEEEARWLGLVPPPKRCDELRQSTQSMSLSQIQLDSRTREATVEISSLDTDTDWSGIAPLHAAAAADHELHTRCFKVAVLYSVLCFVRCHIYGALQIPDASVHTTYVRR